MQVVIIGAGNTATVLGRLFQMKGHKVLQIVNHTISKAQILAKEFGASAIDYSGTINRDADIYVVAIGDRFIKHVASHFNLTGKIVVHTAGSVEKEALQGLSDQYGVLWPMQSLRKETSYVPIIPFAVDGSTQEVVQAVNVFASTLSDQVTIADNTMRLKMHIASVIAANFANHIYALADDFCKKEGIDFKLLVPLIKETAERLELYAPADVQTGPAQRNDLDTITKHISLLELHPYLKRIYLRLTNSIMQMPLPQHASLPKKEEQG
ncbi:MAG: DUF2520 domain-containing protein [Bacteroidota bacterium]|nr:DUF2520 domain-containing protein [Bacteroidota bacterium]